MTHNSDHNWCDRHDVELAEKAKPFSWKIERANQEMTQSLQHFRENIFDILHAPSSLIYSVNSLRHFILSHNLRSKGNHSLKEKIMNMI